MTLKIEIDKKTVALILSIILSVSSIISSVLVMQGVWTPEQGEAFKTMVQQLMKDMNLTYQQVVDALSLQVGSSLSGLAAGCSYLIMHPLGDESITAAKNGTVGSWMWSTDASAVISNALNNGSTTFVKSGLYSITSPIIVNNSCSLLGECSKSGAQTELRGSGLSDFMFKINGTSTRRLSMNFKDLLLNYGGVEYNDSEGLMNNVYVTHTENCDTESLRLNGVYYFLATGCVFCGGNATSSKAAVALCESSDSLVTTWPVFYDCSIEPNDYRGMYVAPKCAVRLTNCLFETTPNVDATFLYLDQGAGYYAIAVIVETEFTGTKGCAILAYGHLEVSRSSFTVINGTAAIYLHQSGAWKGSITDSYFDCGRYSAVNTYAVFIGKDGVTFSGNEVKGESTDSGIRLFINSSNNIVSGNKFYDSPQAALYLTDAHNNTVIGNQFISNTAEAIFLNNAQNNTISLNQVTGSHTYGYREIGTSNFNTLIGNTIMSAVTVCISTVGANTHVNLCWNGTTWIA